MRDDASERLYDLIVRALEVEPEQRREWVEGACGGDPLLRDEVLRVALAEAALGGFLETPAATRFDDLAAPGPPLPPGAEVGRYRLLRVIGSGGSGTVYEALQESPHRKVALKVMAAGLGSSPAAHRFKEEAEILARLSHPGVAHVYDAGVHEGMPWLAIEYVEGKDIRAFADAKGARAKLDLMASVCDAVHHGHEQGILHGDLKPANVLVDAAGRPKVIDFGIARALGADAEAEVAGTPPYMSPEQCGGGRLDVRSDVYALGVMLYELLAGRRPHDVARLPLAEALRVVREEPPAPLAGVDGDVAAIVAKAMARDRGQRYASAAALADDLRRHLAYRPVEAHPGGAAHHALLFARRQPAAFAAILAVVLVSVAAAVVSGRFAVVSARERAEAEFQAYVANLAAASAALRRHDPAEARERLQRAPEGLRGWEWRHLAHGLDASQRTCAWPGMRIAAGAASDDGALLVCAGWGPGYGVRILRADTGETVRDVDTEGRRVDGVALRGDLLALGFLDGGVEVRGAARLELPRHAGQVRAVDLDRSGTRVVSGAYDGVVRVCDTATGRVLVEFKGHEGKVFTARFDPSGTRVCSGDEHGVARIWRVEGGVEERALGCGTSNVEGVAWSPDGARIVTGSFDGSVRLWDAERGTIVRQDRHDAAVKAVAFAPDGKTFASGGLDYAVRIWSAIDGSAMGALVGHEASVYGLAYLAGDRVASFSMDGTVKVWDAVTRRDDLRHRDAVMGVAFDGSGALVSICADGGVRLWDPRGRTLLLAPVPPGQGILLSALAPDGAAAAAADGNVRAWRLPDGTLLGELACVEGLRTLALAPRGTRVAVGTLAGDLHVWDPAAPSARVTWRAHDGEVTALRFDPTGEILASGSATGEVSLWRLGQPAPLATLRAHSSRVATLAFDREGRRLATGAETIRILDARTLAPVAILRGSGGARALAFSPDGSRLASSAGDYKLRLWDAATNRELAILLDRLDAAWTVAWSPDGSMLAAGGGFWELSGAVVVLEAPPQADR